MNPKPLANILIMIILIIASSTGAWGQDFFKDYRNYRLGLLPNGKPKNPKLFNKSITIMQKAFREVGEKYHKQLLSGDSLYIVHYYYIEFAESKTVIWSKKGSFFYSYLPRKPFELHPDASDWIKGYKPEFKKWVETADTLSYNKYGSLASWFDAPVISFTVAIKQQGKWKFISSRSFTNNVDILK